MDEGFVKRLERLAGSSDLADVLAERLSGSDLQSLLLEVFARRAAAQTPADVERRYRESRFLCPSPTDVRRLRGLEDLAFELSAEAGFEPVELSPLAPLGVCSVLGGLSQNVMVSTARINEVCSDPTNVMALECAVRRRKASADEPKSTERVRLCTTHRAVRAQQFDFPGAFAHFRLFAMCSAGRDEGSARFELDSLLEHVVQHAALLQRAGAAGFDVAAVELRVTCLDEIRRPALEEHVLTPLRARFPDYDVAFDDERTTGRAYYQFACFQVNAITSSGEHLFLADGGFTDWTAQLLASKKERLMISGFGTERFCDRA